MTKRSCLGLVVVAALLGGTQDAAARAQDEQQGSVARRHRSHFYFGGQALGLFIAHESTDSLEYLSHGGGAGLFGGFRASPFVAIEINWMFTYHDQGLHTPAGGNVLDIDAFYVMTFSADAKIMLPTRGAIEPYLQAGVGFSYTGATYGGGYTGKTAVVWASGPSFAVGAGVDVYLHAQLSVGGQLLYRGLVFSAPDVPDGEANFVSGLSVQLNTAYHF